MTSCAPHISAARGDPRLPCFLYKQNKQSRRHIVGGGRPLDNASPASPREPNTSSDTAVAILTTHSAKGGAEPTSVLHVLPSRYVPVAKMCCIEKSGLVVPDEHQTLRHFTIRALTKFEDETLQLATPTKCAVRVACRSGQLRIGIV